MCFHLKMLEVGRGVDKEYDDAIVEYFLPYYQFVDSICRIAVQNKYSLTEEVVGFCKLNIFRFSKLIFFFKFKVLLLPKKVFFLMLISFINYGLNCLKWKTMTAQLRLSRF